MYKPKSYEESVIGYSVRGIPETFSITRLSGIIDCTSYKTRREPYSLCLKSEIDFIPIVNVFASNIAIKSDVGTVEELEKKVKLLVRSNVSSYYKGDLDELLKVFDPSIKQMHEAITNEQNETYTPNIPIRGGRSMSTSMRVKTLQDIIDSNNMSNVYTSYKGDNTFLLYPYYYVINDTIVFSMMIKKEYISNFRKNWHNLEIDPSHVEIWINRSYLENNDKTSFSKWIKETFLMKLTMQGFVIKVKGDINSEIINLPRIKPVKTVQDMNALKKAINQMMLS